MIEEEVVVIEKNIYNSNDDIFESSFDGGLQTDKSIQSNKAVLDMVTL